MTIKKQNMLLAYLVSLLPFCHHTDQLLIYLLTDLLTSFNNIHSYQLTWLKLFMDTYQIVPIK